MEAKTFHRVPCNAVNWGPRANGTLVNRPNNLRAWKLGAFTSDALRRGPEVHGIGCRALVFVSMASKGCRSSGTALHPTGLDAPFAKL